MSLVALVLLGFGFHAFAGEDLTRAVDLKIPFPLRQVFETTDSGELRAKGALPGGFIQDGDRAFYKNKEGKTEVVVQTGSCTKSKENKCISVFEREFGRPSLIKDTSVRVAEVSVLRYGGVQSKENSRVDCEVSSTREGGVTLRNCLVFSAANCQNAAAVRGTLQNDKAVRDSCSNPKAPLLCRLNYVKAKDAMSEGLPEFEKDISGRYKAAISSGTWSDIVAAVSGKEIKPRGLPEITEPSHQLMQDLNSVMLHFAGRCADLQKAGFFAAQSGTPASPPTNTNSGVPQR